MNERTLFLSALEKHDLLERNAFVEEACSGDAALRERIEALLRSHEREGPFLDQPAIEQLATASFTDTDGPADGVEVLSLEFLSPSDKAGSVGRLGHYEVQEVIGLGGMGIVLKAVDGKLHRIVAIKVMAAPLANSSAARRRFAREAQAAAAVSHDHIVNIYAVEEADGLPYLVMQYVAGMSLQDRLDRDGPLQLPEILRIGMQTASGLAAAHAQGLIHRDIKPANILLENAVERVKITDFGLARAVDDASLTQSGVVAGTPNYMAPEQARGEALDARTDLFSLGSVLYAMCTGRSPFRASGSMAVLKRVCDESPTPIRETNPEIPDWLAAIIGRLHAKDPAERFQSAAEVADVLSRHLAHVQHPSVAPLPAVPISANGGRRPPRSGRRFALAAAAILLCLLGSLSLTEATGVTQLASMVIRMVTGEGTLVIEVDDPSITVALDGEELTISGAGLQEITLRPGQYQFQAIKDGQPFKTELISIHRGDRQLVRVTREPAAAVPAASLPVERGAFVLLSTEGTEPRKFDTLADAVLGATDGDTIEVRGNGPFDAPPVTVKLPLTIRAGGGYRPQIRIHTEHEDQHSLGLVTAEAALLLEGLELHFVLAELPSEPSAGPYLLMTRNAPLHVANCRFRLDAHGTGACIALEGCPLFVMRHSEVISSSSTSVGSHNDVPDAAQWHIDNCVLVGKTNLAVGYVRTGQTGATIELTHNTLVAESEATHVSLWAAPASDELPEEARPIRVDATANVIGGTSVMCFQQIPEFLAKQSLVPLQSAEAEQLLVRLVAWHGTHNLYEATMPLLTLNLPQAFTTTMHFAPADSTANLAGWMRFWSSPESGSLQGKTRYQGGNLLGRFLDQPDEITPDDFRLRPDSAGYRAGPDGKDLGVDIDLVGPGEAYERWKKTPEYQQWLKETGQLNDLATATPEPGAFVLFGGAGVAERRFDTLAEAVLRASDGDTIEVRGNGPFVVGPMELRISLTIRAGDRFQPVFAFAASEGDDEWRVLSSLRLEGLELRSAVNAYRTIYARGPLAVSNCRFVKQTPGICIGCAADCDVRNCQLSSQHGAPLAIEWYTNITGVVENCLLIGHVNLEDRDIAHIATMRFTNNTFISAAAVNAFYHIMYMPRDQTTQIALERVGVFMSGSIVGSESFVFDLLQPEEFSPAFTAEEVETWWPRRIHWHEERNLYPLHVDLLGITTYTSRQEYRDITMSRGKELADWNEFWSMIDTGSLQGVIRFQGGDLNAMSKLNAAALTPDDFRLRPDSAGYRAGPDGKDLGADVDLVGPGEAYERWKMTPEYQEWLKETEPMK